MKYGTLGHVTGGRLRLEQREPFLEAFAAWPDGPVWATFETALVFRSPLQNAHWHAAVVRPLARAASVAPRQMHEALKVLLLPERVTIPGAGTVTIGGSTARLTRREAGNVTDRALALVHAAEGLELEGGGR